VSTGLKGTDYAVEATSGRSSAAGFVPKDHFKFGPGDCVSCVLDMDDGVLKMSRNGAPAVTVFEGLKGTLSPFVSLYKKGNEVRRW
jgi:hypothetical protein